MVVGDDSGHFITCAFRVMNGVFEVREGEAVGLREALSWVKNLGYHKVIFELSCKAVVDVVMVRTEDVANSAL
ncbi:conserved hypothetical protein [Ricinus communis]|uniref:RNase H type-1 domain-containing protein n=1 Tax=Ricinus communis TaxID=3988 RepID=B9RC13_RICCO|nr:conserved hypothetical protein [Ricinus communis]